MGVRGSRGRSVRPAWEQDRSTLRRPHWEATDGSKILGTLKERVDAPAADAIPWLLLETKSVGPADSFSKVTGVQRVNTVGGIAPKNGCAQAAVGTPARINYIADYFFIAR
jgi:hypothetical protein